MRNVTVQVSDISQSQTVTTYCRLRLGNARAEALQALATIFYGRGSGLIVGWLSIGRVLRCVPIASL